MTGHRYELVGPILPELDELAEDLRTALATKWLSNRGPFLQRLEERLGEVLGGEHVVATSSCTLGLIATLKALGWTGEVIVPAFTFPATVHAIHWAGCRPVLADVDADTFLLDPESVARLIGPETAGIVAVDVFGLPACGPELEAAAGGLPVLVDAAHSLGARREDAFEPHARVHSLHATKPIAAGEGGVVVTADAELAERVRCWIDFGFGEGWDCVEVGLNAKMPELSAILAYHQLEHFEASIRQRRAWVERYRDVLAGTPGLRFQATPASITSSHPFVALRVDAAVFGRTRDELRAALLEAGIVTRPYFDPPAHRLTCYAGRLRCDDLARTEALSRSVLCLPLHADGPPAIAEEIGRRIAALAAGGAGRPGAQRGRPLAESGST